MLCAWSTAGIDALRVIDRGGSLGQLSEEDKAWLRAALIEWPTAHGFGTQQWTLKRVRHLVKRRFGIAFSEMHILELDGNKK